MSNDFLEAVIARNVQSITQLESDLATAEQDSRQKDSRIARLEAAVKELRKAIKDALEFSPIGHVFIDPEDVKTLLQALASTEGAT